MNDVSFSSNILVVFGQKMHGILQRQWIGILLEIVCHFKDSALYRRIPKHITLEKLDLGVSVGIYGILMFRSVVYILWL